LIWYAYEKRPKFDGLILMIPAAKLKNEPELLIFNDHVPCPLAFWS